MKFMATFEIELPDQEIEKFKELAKEMGKSFPETYMLCASQKRDELLDMFRNNIPPDGNSTEPPRIRAESEA